MEHLNAHRQLLRYLSLYPAEADSLSELASQLTDEGMSVFDRKNMRGHITASALVLNEARTAMLMIHHNFYQCWLQPGGHNECGDDLIESAVREVDEETGVTGLVLLQVGPPVPFDIDSHSVDANPAKNEGSHVHHDYTYLFYARGDSELVPQLAEVGGARWMNIAEQASLASSRQARLARKLQAYLYKTQ